MLKLAVMQFYVSNSDGVQFLDLVLESIRSYKPTLHYHTPLDICDYEQSNREMRPFNNRKVVTKYNSYRQLVFHQLFSIVFVIKDAESRS